MDQNKINNSAGRINPATPTPLTGPLNDNSVESTASPSTGEKAVTSLTPAVDSSVTPNDPALFASANPADLHAINTDSQTNSIIAPENPENSKPVTNTWDSSVNNTANSSFSSSNEGVSKPSIGPSNLNESRTDTVSTPETATPMVAPIVPVSPIQSGSMNSLNASEEVKEVNYMKAWYAIAVTRILLGFIFLWTILDKLFGLGFPTPSGRGLVDGSSATSGFLMDVTKADPGPFAGLFSPLIGQPWADWLYMLALVGLAGALLLGIGLRIAAIGGALFMALLWMATAWPDYNPVIDEHIIYAVVLFIIALTPRRWSLVNWWLSIPFVKQNKWLW